MPETISSARLLVDGIHGPRERHDAALARHVDFQEVLGRGGRQFGRCLGDDPGVVDELTDGPRVSGDDAAELMTNELIGEINRFDAEAIAKAARDYRSR